MAVISNIACVLPRPDIAELRDQIAAEISKRLLGGAPVLPLSTEDVEAYVMAGVVNTMYGAVSQALRENDPATQCCDNLVVYGASHGVDLASSTRAKGYVAITGTPLAPIPATIRFVGASSREYKPDPGVTFNPTTLDNHGAAVLRTVAAVAGSVFNLPASSPLTVSTTIPDIDIDAVVVGNGLTGGTDDEDCESLRARVVAAEQRYVTVVNEDWYLQRTMTYPGVTRACTDACRGCCDPSFIAIYVFMEGVYGDATTAPFGVPPCEVLDEMSDWMFGPEPERGQGLAPLGIRGRYQQAMPVVLDVGGACLSGCAIRANDRVAAALWTFIRGNLCVGSAICREQLRAIAVDAIGPANCLSSFQLTFGEGVSFEDDAFTYLDCGRFLVLGNVDLQPVSSPSKSDLLLAKL